MIKRLFSWEQKFTVANAATIIGVLFLISKFVGLYRQRLFASHFGLSDTLDIYLASFRIPDFIVGLLVLGTLSVAFIPIFAELRLTSEEKANRLGSTILNVSFIVISVISLILLIFSRPITHLMVPGFSGYKFDQTVLLTRIFLLSPIIFALSNVFSGILNAQKKFFVTGLAPILYNLGIIFGLVYLYPRWGLTGLAYGVILGALMHLAVQIPEAVRNGFHWLPILDIRDPSFKKFIKLFVPRIFGIDISQFSLIIATIIGSLLATGSITAYNFANDLQSVPIGMFAISLAFAAFPLLSELYAQNDEREFIKVLSDTFVQILFFMIPITILLLLLRAHVVRLTYGAGRFDWSATKLTLNVLGIFSLSLFSQALTPLLSRAFYARKNTALPVVIGLLSMAVNAILAYILGIRYGAPGMAAGFSIASVFNALALFVLLRLQLVKSPEARQALAQFDRDLIVSSFKIVLASIGLGVACYATLYLVEPFLNTRTFLGLLAQASLATLAGLVVFFALCYLLKLDNGRELLRGILKRLHLS